MSRAKSMGRPRLTRTLLWITQLRGPSFGSCGTTGFRIAVRAVGRLGDISDVPVTNAQDARFLANIVFADSVEEHAELTRELEKSMSEGLAAGYSDYIQLGG